jgi:hypothetical protein
MIRSAPSTSWLRAKACRDRLLFSKGTPSDNKRQNSVLISV